MSDYYQVLGISEDADQGTIKKQFRQLSLRWHPDKNNGDDTKFKKINEAYQTLGDIEKRKQYDLQRRNPFFSPIQGHGQIDPGEIFKMFFGGGVPPNMPPFEHMGCPPGFGEGGIPGIRFHGNGFSFPVPRRKPPPIMKTILITFEQSFAGMDYPLEIERWIEDNGIKTVESEKLYIPIPEGIYDGEMLKMEGKGNCIDGVRSSLKVFIKVSNDTKFERRGLDLVFRKKLTLKEALTGFTFELKFLQDTTYTINNHSGKIIGPGYQKYVSKMGMKRKGSVGNLIILFDVEFPKTLSVEQIKSLTKIL